MIVERIPVLSAFEGFVMIISQMIGSGIFSSPGQVLALVGAPVLAIILWIVGSLVSLCGSLSYIELGTMIPKSGGERAYLDSVYKNSRKLIPFLFCWTMILCIRPGAAAVNSIVSSEYILYSAFGSQESKDKFLGIKWAEWMRRLLAFAVISLVTLTYAIRVRLAINIHITIGMMKLLLLSMFSCCGLLVAVGLIDIPKTHVWSEPFRNTSPIFGNYVSALYRILWSFDGWGVLTFSVGDVDNAKKVLPRAAITGVGVTSILYIFTNISYFSVIPYDVAVQSNDVISAVYTRIIFGQIVGSRVLPIFLGLGLYGSVSAVTYSVTRIILSAAEAGYLPYKDVFVKLHPTLRTPINALLLNWVITSIYIFSPPSEQAFDIVTGILRYPTWIFYGVAVFGLICLRLRQPDAPRPFRVWPIAIFFFLLVCVLLITPFVVPLSAHSDYIPDVWVGLIALGIVLAGIPVWYLKVVRNAPQLSAKDSLESVHVESSEQNA
ncbi:amino acid transporter [Basidiobolus meristosporus CBS 931.73]|uniref:Amino acid transporter n=1 Tax=Basidiobolus meristosporus CBS 931.73 TaxID=1314790 RepID=A0A1Y1Z3U6_9FUNG|nr:amino acid transporter [Basidiobolus meristosporus CBS 931.73]|eukprot:ORY04525.1 amino acid transporter [Basidiobolus meristosporus CBS 931.73]